MPFPIDPYTAPADVAARLAIVRAEKVAKAGGAGGEGADDPDGPGWDRNRDLVGRARDWLPMSGVMPNGRRWRKAIPEE